MAWAAPAQTRCGVTVCTPSGMDLVCLVMMLAPLESACWGRLWSGAWRALLAGDLRAQAVFLLTQFGREFGTEVLRLKYLADFDHTVLVVWVGAALDPLDRLFPGLDVPHPEARDQFLGFRKGPVDHGA